MHWKTVKINHLRHPKQWSITLRLVWIYTLSTFIILTVVTTSLYWIYTQRLQSENSQFLTNKIVVIQKVLQKEPADQEFYQEEAVLEPKLDHYYLRITDQSGKTVLETPRMSTLVPNTAFKADNKTTRWIAPKSHHREKYFLLISAPVDQTGTRFIQIAKDISVEHDIIDDYRQILMWVLAVGVLGSAILGVIVTYRGLKPLRDMAQSTQRINATHLRERLNPTAWPKELFNLAISFNEMLDRIEEGVNRLSQFSGDLAHELRTPINILMGEAEIALSKPRTNAEYCAVIESSTEELARITRMIENLLFLARAENPESVVNFESLSLQHIMNTICSFYEAAAEEKNIKIQCQGDAKVNADPLMLRRALNNLVHNALQYSTAGGVITLSAKSINGTTYLSVSDTGEGIAAVHLPHLFNRFYRTDKARSTKTGGTGLGLAIVRSIMDLHRGDVVIESEPGKGTTVTLIFP